MAVQPAVALSPIPEFPALADRAAGTYNNKAYAFGAHLGTPGPFVGQVNALAANVRANALEAQQQAEAAGVARSGAETARDQAADERAGAQAARAGAQAARDDLAALDALWLGAATADPVLGKNGAPLVAGNVYVNTVSGMLRAYSGDGWVAGISTVAGVQSINGRQGSIDLPRVLGYDGRAALRTDEISAHAIVDGLGWFRWVAGSDEPDDDESCFSTNAGRWLLQVPHWDLWNAWTLPDREWSDARLQAAYNMASRVLKSAVESAITSVSAGAQVTFVGTVAGALVGAAAFASPPNALGPLVSVHAVVTAVDTVTVYINNPSASSQALTPGAWNLIVIKD